MSLGLEGGNRSRRWRRSTSEESIRSAAASKPLARDFNPSVKRSGTEIGEAGVAGLLEQFGPSQGSRGASETGPGLVASVDQGSALWNSLPQAANRAGDNAAAARIAKAIPDLVKIGLVNADSMANR
jgi:hypothetical protein